MGKISKNSNLYDKNGKFLHKPGKYTIEEYVYEGNNRLYR